MYNHIYKNKCNIQGLKKNHNTAVLNISAPSNQSVPPTDSIPTYGVKANFARERVDSEWMNTSSCSAVRGRQLYLHLLVLRHTLNYDGTTTPLTLIGWREWLFY